MTKLGRRAALRSTLRLEMALWTECAYCSSTVREQTQRWCVGNDLYFRHHSIQFNQTPIELASEFDYAPQSKRSAIVALLRAGASSSALKRQRRWFDGAHC